jgi:hypothetical protein
MRGISFLVSPIRDHAFFEQAVFQGEVRHQDLHVANLAPQLLDLGSGRGPLRIPGQPPLAGLEELLRPAVIKALGNPSRRQSSAMLYSPRNPSNTIRIFSSAE